MLDLSSIGKMDCILVGMVKGDDIVFKAYHVSVHIIIVIMMMVMIVIICDDDDDDDTNK